MKTKLLLCLPLLLPFVAAAADQVPPLRLTAELRDGSRVVGTSTEKNLRFHSDLLGNVKLAVKDIRMVEWAGTNAVKLKATNGDTLALHTVDSRLTLQTGFGKVDLPLESIRKLSVTSSTVAVPQRDGLIGFWSGNGNAGDSTDNNPGTLIAGAGYGPGPAGQAFNFEKSGSFVKIPGSAAFNPGSQVTVEFWMKAAPDNAMNNYQGLVTTDFYGVEISNGYGGTMGVNFFLSTTANARPIANGTLFRAMGIGYYTEISDANGGGAPVSADQWHHVAATYDSRFLRLYIDGAPWKNPVPHTGRISPMSAESFVAIGSEDGRTASPDCIGNRYFHGQIANVAIYKRALAAAEVQEDYEAQKPE